MSEVRHLSRSELEMFVIGGLDDVHAARVEAHVLECERCSAALAGEARLEMALDEIANAPVTRDLPTPRPVTRLVPASERARGPMRNVAIAAVGALSLAAAWLLWLTPGTHYGASAAAGGDGSDVATTSHASASQDAATTRIYDAMSSRAFDQLDGG